MKTLSFPKNGEAVFIGIDPGKEGAITLVSDEKLEVFDLNPFFPDSKINQHQFVDFVWALADRFPHQTFIISSELVGFTTENKIPHHHMYNFGHSTGVIEACFRMLQSKCRLVSYEPKRWKDFYKKILKVNRKTSKAEWKTWAHELFPQYQNQIKRIDQADSLLINYYGVSAREMLQKGQSSKKQSGIIL